MATIRLPKPLLRPATKKKPPKKAPTKRAPTKRSPTKRTSPARLTTPKDRADAAIAAIRQAKAESDAEHYAIGKALLKLRTPAILKLYAAATFREFLDEHVMPHSTAERMMMIAGSYTQTLALKIGLERSFQLARLAEADPDIKKPPAQLWKQNPMLSGKRVQSMTAADMQRLVSAANLKKRLAKAGKPPEPEASDTSAIAQFKSDWADVFGDLEASIRFNPRKRTVRIEFHVDELFEEEE